MRTYVRAFVPVAVALLSSCLWAQGSQLPVDAGMLARFSYNNSGFIESQDSRNLCLAVSREGNYQMIRVLRDGETQRLAGKMNKEDFSQLQALLQTKDFQAISGSGGGLIRQEAETFSAEVFATPQKSDKVPTDSAIPKVHRFEWVNADGEKPFPDPVSKVVSWLQSFQPKDGRAFDYAEFSQICPSKGLSLIQPSVATNKQP